MTTLTIWLFFVFFFPIIQSLDHLMRRKRRFTQTLIEGIVSPGITVQDHSRHDSVLVPVSSRRIEKAEKVCAKTVVIMYHMVDTV